MGKILELFKKTGKKHEAPIAMCPGLYALALYRDIFKVLGKPKALSKGQMGGPRPMACRAVFLRFSEKLKPKISKLKHFFKNSSFRKFSRKFVS